MKGRQPEHRSRTEKKQKMVPSGAKFVQCDPDLRWPGKGNVGIFWKLCFVSNEHGQYVES